MNTRSLTQPKPSSSAPVQAGLLQRKYAQCNEKGEMQRQAVNQTNVSEVPASAHDVLNSPGQSSDPATRAFTASRSVHDFSQIPIHNPANTDESGQNIGRSPENLSMPASPLSQGGILQRKCACGNTAGSSGTCAECQKKGGMALPGNIQAKLTINQPRDRYEQEADRVAEKIMTMTNPAASSVQRDINLEEKKEDIQTKTLANTITPILQRQVLSGANSVQRKPALQEAGNEGSFEAGQDLENRLNNSDDGGSPLPDDVRSFMEPRFGADFSQVRVHTGNEAVEMNQDLNAQAFAHKQDIYFGVGKSPGMNDLTAHELTHVVQQTGRVQTTASSLHVQRQDDSNDGAGQQQQQSNGGAGGSSIIYICSKDLETSPIGKHAFFRIGGAGKGNPTRSLEPVDRGADCWQGQPMYDFSADVSANAKCEAISITESCLNSQFIAYAIGHYCTLGPNSNTFVGTLARKCGVSNPDPPGFTPGIDDKPPLSGTFAPSPSDTLLNCSQKICDASRETLPNEILA